MRIRINSYSTLALLIAAILLWAGVGYFAYSIASGQSSRASHVANREAEVMKQETQLKLHALARETKEERAQFEAIASPGIIDILDAIEAVGKDAGVKLTVGRALGTDPKTEASDVRSAALAIEAAGTFAEVVRIAALLDSLAVPSRVNEIHFELLVGEAPEGPWRMIAEVQFLTTSDIST